jgi:hypothetical protein
MISIAITLLAIIGFVFALRTGRLGAFWGAASGQYKLAGT